VKDLTVSEILDLYLRFMPRAREITVVIPTLNEADSISGAVESVAGGAGEVIVADGGSSDATVAAARSAGARVIRAPRGRAAQMEAGARVASAEWLVFLHADTRLESGWDEALLGLDTRFVGGAFRFGLDSGRARYRLVEAAVRARCAVLGLPYGDQALFARRDAFVACGGFGDVPILEDVDFVRRLRRRGALAFLGVRAVTSPRRWEQSGFVRTTLLNWLVVALGSVGVPRARLARLYGARH
jgi:rSAM/selenodomain-associated transferase 2